MHGEDFGTLPEHLACAFMASLDGFIRWIGKCNTASYQNQLLPLVCAGKRVGYCQNRQARLSCASGSADSIKEYTRFRIIAIAASLGDWQNSPTCSECASSDCACRVLSTIPVRLLNSWCRSATRKSLLLTRSRPAESERVRLQVSLWKVSNAPKYVLSSADRFRRFSLQGLCSD